ncbi:zinc knuckle-domain-containing protein [Mycena capillaripes]|nr:zinc knuckle-domain-containing protein [Mycena capillaripes]
MSKFAPHRQSSRPRATQSTICQKCLKTGHFIYECKFERPYVSRPSRTQQLENPRVLAKLKEAGKPSVEVPEEFKKKDGTANRILEEKAKEREKGKERESKKARRSSASSGSNSEDSSSSDSSSSSSSNSDASGRSRERDRKRRVPTKRDRTRSRSP